MKKLTVLAVLAALVFYFIPQSLVWAGEEEGGLSFEFKSKSQSSYIGTFGYKTNVGTVIVNEAALGSLYGFNIYFWNLWGFSSQKSDEWDGFITRSDKLWDLKIDSGAGYCDMRDFLNSTGLQTDYWNIYVEVSKEFPVGERHKLFPYIKGEWYSPVKANKEGDKEGFPITLGLRHEWQAGKAFSFPLTIKSDARAFHDPGLFGGENVWLGKLTTQALWQVTKNVAVILPFADFSTPFSNVKDKDGREFSAVIGAGIILSF